jgi:hypothetical protein
MINASTAANAQTGSKIELWHGDHVILAEVVWRDGRRAGLRSDERVPVEEILALSKAPSLQLTAVGQWPHVDRRRKPRRHGDSRTRSRAVEFAGVAVIAVCLSGAAFEMVEQAFAKPLAYVEAALGG